MPSEGWSVELHRSVVLLVHSLPRRSVQAIYRAMAQLTTNPRPEESQSIPGMPNTFEYYVESFRIVYQIEEEQTRIKIAIITLRF